MAKAKPVPVATEQIAPRIFMLRGEKVLLDADLAELYGTSTGRFNEQVKRNLERFPKDFMFQLTEQEFRNLRSQFATSSLPPSWGGRRYPPFAFTEHGAIMAASVLNTPRAIEVSVYVVRAFVQLRELLFSNKALTKRLDELEARIERKLDSHDQAITGLIHTIRELMTPADPTPPKKRRIGFVQDES
jgi:ORF6N domain